MVSATLNLRPNGAVTLPKEWRDQFSTTHFLAIATPEGLLIKPILEVEYYEDDEGNFGLRFPTGIDPASFLKMMDATEDTLRRKKTLQRKGKKPQKK